MRAAEIRPGDVTALHTTAPEQQYEDVHTVPHGHGEPGEIIVLAEQMHSFKCKEMQNANP